MQNEEKEQIVEIIRRETLRVAECNSTKADFVSIKIEIFASVVSFQSLNAAAGC
jgi:hypothetical protein